MSDTKSDTESSKPTSDTEDTRSDSSVPLELDRDGCDLIDPLTDEDYIPDYTSEFGVTSFHEDLRYTPDPGTPVYTHEPTAGVTSLDNSVYLSPSSSPNSNNSNDTVIDFDVSLTMAPTTSEKYIKTYKKNSHF